MIQDAKACFLISNDNNCSNRLVSDLINDLSFVLVRYIIC